ncbi:MAG: CDP-glycerol glycerophosphotransferase family protein [Sphingomicrobium sp.]
MTSSRPDRRGIAGRVGRVAATLVANGLIYPLSKLMPRRRDQWLFGHQDGAFAGNCKFLFLWLHLHRPDLRATWVTSDPDVLRSLCQHGFAACRKGGPSAIWRSLRSAVYCVCHGPEDVSLGLSGGALVVNLWHGVGLKSLRLGNPNSPAVLYGGPSANWLTRTLHLGPRLTPDVLVTPSDFMQHHFSSQFGLPEERCPILGYPRLDGNLDPSLTRQLGELPGSEPNALWPDGVAEVYAYLPTFRDTRREFLSDAIPDFDRLEAALEKRNAILYLKPHRHTALGAWKPSERIRLWPRGVDVDASLPHLSGLITDYSSVHYDYIFHSAKGSILYMFDEEEYTSSDRLLLYPLRENTAGWRADNFDELVRLIESGEALNAVDDVARVRAKFWGEAVGPASPRIVDHVEQLLGAKGPTSGGRGAGQLGSERTPEDAASSRAGQP